MAMKQRASPSAFVSVGVTKPFLFLSPLKDSPGTDGVLWRGGLRTSDGHGPGVPGRLQWRSLGPLPLAPGVGLAGGFTGRLGALDEGWKPTSLALET